MQPATSKVVFFPDFRHRDGRAWVVENRKYVWQILRILHRLTQGAGNLLHLIERKIGYFFDDLGDGHTLSMLMRRRRGVNPHPRRGISPVS